MFNISGIKLDIPVFQAPLSGYSDYAMRQVSREFGCPLTFAGVMLAKSAANPRVLRRREFQPGEDEYPVGAQILGREPDVMVAAAKGLEQVGFDIIDLNFACPVAKVLRRGRGGALLDEPGLLLDISRKVRDAVKVPVTVKLRTSVNSSSESMKNFWQIIENIPDTGIDMVVVHGRSVAKLYRGTADWDMLGKIKQRLPDMLVGGSGDVFTAEAAETLIKDIGLDAVAVARGAIGNPWLFAQMKAKFRGRELPAQPTLAQQALVLRHHYEMVSKLHPEVKSIGYFRKFLTRYCKLHPQRKKVQAAMMAVKRASDLLRVIEENYNQ